MDSAAVFAERLSDLGLANWKPKFVAAEWSTHGLFAFSAAAAAADQLPDTELRHLILSKLMEGMEAHTCEFPP